MVEQEQFYWSNLTYTAYKYKVHHTGQFQPLENGEFLAMQLTFVDRAGVLTADLKDFAIRRFQFALSRFDSKIQGVQVVLSDENGPRGGVDQSCKVAVKMRRLDDINLTCNDSDLEKCLARAADRCGRAVTRTLEKSQRFGRQRVSSRLER